MNLKFNENYIFLIMFKSLFFFSFKFILVCTCTVNKSYKFDRKTLLLNWERYRFRLISDKALKYFLIELVCRIGRMEWMWILINRKIVLRNCSNETSISLIIIGPGKR